MSDVIQSTTQQFLDIYDITNNYVIMKDGTVSTILSVDAMNFGLLAEEEQDAIMYAYAGLLNSLNYTIQIIINSQTKDVTSYLRLLQEQEAEAENETLRARIRMYREFVGNLIHERNVLDKKFYVVIPASSLELGIAGAKSVLPGKSTFDITTIERSVIIEKAQTILDPKRDHMIAQFARIGLFSRQLTTQEIIQLFYIRYNPEAAEGQQIGESKTYTTPLVKASIQGNFLNAAAMQPPTAQTEPALPTEPMPAETQVQPLPEIHVVSSAPEEQSQIATTPTLVQSPPFPDVAPVEEQLQNSVAPNNDQAQTAAPTIQHTEPTAVPEVMNLENPQADINATIQSLGTALPATDAPADLPPLPEI